MHKISFDKYSLLIDGNRVYIKSGAFHYFRSPGIDSATDRFRKMKASGYNAVDLYFNWAYHSKKQGEYDFSGLKDIRKVLKSAKETGLWVIARPGPFLNGELNGGGVPFWLLQDKDVIPRNRVGMEYVYSQKYMDYVKEWYDNIIPILNEFDNIILFQIENEYATESMEEDYMKTLYSWARERGIKCPIFHNDAYIAGLWADVVDIYAADIYPYINPEQDWKNDNFCFDTLDNFEEISRGFKDSSPLFIAEMQGGWFDKWTGNGYENMRKALGDEEINIMMKTAISQGVTIFNVYMGVGGTSWGNLACDEVYTSYEFTDGIDEYGLIRENLYKTKAVNYFLNSFDLTKTKMSDEPILDGTYENIYAKCRVDEINQCKWFFVRNMTEENKKLSLKDGYEVSLKPYDMKIMPVGLRLKACTLEFSDCEIFAKLSDETKEVIFMLSDSLAKLHITDFEGKKYEISADKKDFENLKFEFNGKITEFVFLTNKTSNHAWLLENKIIFNVDFVYPDETVAISETKNIAYFDIKNGFSEKSFKFDVKDKSQNLTDFDVSFCANEIDTDFDYSNWQKISQGSKLDSLSVGITDEFIWYKTQIPDDIKEITISARHLFGLYINGKEILNRNSYKYEKLQQVEETISVALEKKFLPKVQNELTILVQNLGFEKGFSNETNSPRGLVEFATTPEKKLEFCVKEGLNCDMAPRRGALTTEVAESDSPYLVKLSKKFSIEQNESLFAPKYVLLKDFDYERATIFVNGVKIGRYLKNNKNIALQEKFYIPEAFLKEENLLEVIIWEKEANITSSWGFKNDLKHVIIQLGSQAVYKLY